MTTHVATETIIQEITINAPAERIFAALTDPQQRKQWWSTPGRFQTEHMESDLRVGGKWSMSGTGPRGPFTIKGEYSAVEPPHLLAFTWLPSWQAGASETLVCFDLSEDGGVTTVRLTHSGLTPEAAHAHKGWPQILDSLRAYTER